MTRLDETVAFEVVTLRHRLHEGKIPATYEATFGQLDSNYEELVAWLGPMVALALQGATPETVMKRILGMTATAMCVAAQHAIDQTPASGITEASVEELREVARCARALLVSYANASTVEENGEGIVSDEERELLWQKVEERAGVLSTAFAAMTIRPDEVEGHEVYPPEDDQEVPG